MTSKTLGVQSEQIDMRGRKAERQKTINGKRRGYRGSILNQLGVTQDF
jgi:hypothetical protein